MKTETYYRVAINQNSEIYSHFEPCGVDLNYAEKQFDAIKKECEDDDTVELQKTTDYENWEKIK